MKQKTVIPHRLNIALHPSELAFLVTMLEVQEGEAKGRKLYRIASDAKELRDYIVEQTMAQLPIPLETI